MPRKNRYLFLLPATLLACGEAAASPVLYAWGNYFDGSSGSQTYVIDPIAATVMAVRGAGGGDGSAVSGGSTGSSGTSQGGSSGGGGSGGSGSGSGGDSSGFGGGSSVVGGSSLASGSSGSTAGGSETIVVSNTGETAGIPLEDLIPKLGPGGDPNLDPPSHDTLYPGFLPPGPLTLTGDDSPLDAFAVTAAVAEPTPLGLIGIALAVLGMTLRRKAATANHFKC